MSYSITDNSSLAVQNMMAECDNGTSIALAQAKSRAFIPPLELQADMTMERKRLSSKKEKEVRYFWSSYFQFFP